MDTRKYEGCRKTAWRCVGQPYTELAEAMAEIHRNGPNSCTPADLELLADAPLLLEEVKRLREENQRYLDYLVQVADEYTDADGITYEIYCKFGDEEE